MHGKDVNAYPSHARYHQPAGPTSNRKQKQAVCVSVSVSVSGGAAVGLVRSCFGHILVYFHISVDIFNSVLQTTLDSLSGHFEQEQLVLLDETGRPILKTKRRNPGTHPGNPHTPSTHPTRRACLWTVGANLPLC